MPLFDLLFTVGFLLRKSIQLYSHHTGVLRSVDGFGHAALQLPEFFQWFRLEIPNKFIRSF